MAKRSDKPKKLKAAEAFDQPQTQYIPEDFTHTEDFKQSLINAGYTVQEEAGVVMIITDQGYFSVIDEIYKLVKQSDYRGSFGVRTHTGKQVN